MNALEMRFVPEPGRFQFRRPTSGPRTQQLASGPKYSINVTADCEVRLCKSGVPGRVFGVTDAVGPNQVKELLCEAAKEYGTLYRIE